MSATRSSGMVGTAPALAMLSISLSFSLIWANRFFWLSCSTLSSLSTALREASSCWMVSSCSCRSYWSCSQVTERSAMRLTSIWFSASTVFCCSLTLCTCLLSSVMASLCSLSSAFFWYSSSMSCRNSLSSSASSSGLGGLLKVFSLLLWCMPDAAAAASAAGALEMPPGTVMPLVRRVSSSRRMRPFCSSIVRSAFSSNIFSSSTERSWLTLATFLICLARHPKRSVLRVSASL
mmetsp:Transcript_25788/g.63987  ORF Transcript_25788/g.63987 Transcript_25788/m.63987 type:complete len:235 (+) Transcript_25788:832-1536(+)